ncbi:MAG: PPC domain-containing protein, partial [Anaeroplasmataceae bacterium]|nr:PPC domain-containing protein [Anaeroplasmataceae bacterium]
MKSLIKKGIGILILIVFAFSFSIISNASEENADLIEPDFTELEANYVDPSKVDYGIKQNIDLENIDPAAMDEFENKSILAGKQSEVIYTDDTGTHTIKEYNEVSEEYQIATLNDSYEDNDSFKKASCLHEAKGTFFYSLMTSARGTISQKSGSWGKKYIDTDYYYVDSILTGIIEIELYNIPTGCDYDLKLYRQPNTVNSSYDSSEVIATSARSSNSDESITMNITAGTYYIQVYSYGDKTWNNDEYYNMRIRLYTGEEYEDMIYNIPNGKKAGDLGALWLCDFAPMGITPSGLSNDATRTYYSCYDTYPMIKSLASTYKNQDFTYAVLYIWNLEVRTAIYKVAEKTLNYVEGYNEWQDKTNQQVNMIFNTSGLILSFGSVFSVACPPVSLGLGIAGAATAVVGLAVNLFLPSAWNVTKANFREYLINLKAAMEVGKGTSSEEVVMMKIKYHFSDKFDCGTNRYIYYAPK